MSTEQLEAGTIVRMSDTKTKILQSNTVSLRTTQIANLNNCTMYLVFYSSSQTKSVFYSIPPIVKVLDKYTDSRVSKWPGRKKRFFRAFLLTLDNKTQPVTPQS
jgi:hypothetical protein